MRGKNIFWGVFFILAAVYVLLSQLDIIVGVNLFSLVVTVLLIPVIAKSVIHRQFGGVLVPIAIIACLYDEPLHITAITPWPLIFCAILLSMGLSFIFSTHHHEEFISGSRNCETSEENDEIVDISVKGSGSVKYITSKQLSRINVKASFAGIKVYFDKADIKGNEAVVNVDASFAGVELYIPKNWDIINNVDTSLGGVDVSGYKSNDGNRKTLVINGYIKLSGITIKYI